MPDFGLSEALAGALKSLKGANYLRAPEAAAAAREAAPEAGAAAGKIPAVTTPSINPDMPDIGAPKPNLPDLPALGRTPPPDAPPTVADAPAVAPDAPAAVSPIEAPGASPADVVAPKVGQTPVEAAGTPPAPGVKENLPTPARSPLEKDVTNDASRFVNANLGEFEGKLNLSHMPNVNNIIAPDGLKAGILQVAEDNKGLIDAARRDTVSNEQLLGAAQDLAVQPQTLQAVLNRELGTQFASPEQVLAARLIGVNTLGETANAAIPILKGSPTTADILEYARRKQLFVQVQTQLQGGLAEQGRGLHVASIPAAGTLPAEVLDHIATIYKANNPNLAEEATAIGLAQRPAGIATILHGSLPTRIAKAAYSIVQRVFINGILSGPPTWAKIFVGNNFNLALSAVDMQTAGIIRGMKGLAARLGRYPTSAEGAQMGDAFTYVHGAISAGNDGLRLAARTMKTGVSMDNLLRFDPSEVSGIKNVDPKLGTTQSLIPELQDTFLGRVAKGMDTAIDIPGSRVIGGIDEFTKTLGGRGYRTMMVMREINSKLQDGTLQPGDADVVARDMFENPSPEMQQAEEDWAHRMTFQSAFPEGGPMEAFSNLIANQVPALKFIFPFMRTMTNIMKQTGEHTPFALLSANIRNQLRGGGMTADMIQARIATGTIIGSGLAWMAVHDRMTGDAPKDPKERALWEADGRTPNSIRITNPVTGEDTWHPYGWLEPIATLASMISNSARIFSYVHQDEDIDSLPGHAEMLGDAISHIMASIITTVGDKTFMTGATKFSEMFADPEKGFQNWAQDTGSSLVPYSKGIEWTRNLKDQYQRYAFTTLEKIENDLPGQSDKLGARLDLFGNERKGRGILGPMSPFPGTPVGEDSVVDELDSLMAATHTVPFGMPDRKVSMGSGPGKGILGGSGLPLTSDEYSQMVIMGRKDPVFDGGTLNLHDKLAQVMQGSTYQGATPAERVAIVGKYASTADQIGRTRLYTENEDFRNRMVAYTDSKKAIYTGQQ